MSTRPSNVLLAACSSHSKVLVVGGRVHDLAMASPKGGFESTVYVCVCEHTTRAQLTHVEEIIAFLSTNFASFHHNMKRQRGMPYRNGRNMSEPRDYKTTTTR